MPVRLWQAHQAGERQEKVGEAFTLPVEDLCFAKERFGERMFCIGNNFQNRLNMNL